MTEEISLSEEARLKIALSICWKWQSFLLQDPEQAESSLLADFASLEKFLLALGIQIERLQKENSCLHHRLEGLNEFMGVH